MKIEISETLYREMRSVVVGLQHAKDSTRYQNAIRRGRRLARKLPKVDILKHITVKQQNNED